jgi:flagellar protein FliO/FliZ
MIFSIIKTLKIEVKIFFSAALFLFSTKVFSVDDVTTQLIKSDIMKSDPMSGSYLMQLILGLFVVVLCIVALAWFAKKMNRFHSVANDSLKIISGISMGARERIVLLQVGDEQLLVGVSPGRINKLHVLSAEITASNEASSDIESNKSFSDKLKTMMADASNNSKK